MPFLAAGEPVGRSFDQRFLSAFEQRTEPCDASRGEVLDPAHLLDLLEHSAHLRVQSRRIGLEPNRHGRQSAARPRGRPGPSRARRDRASLCQHALAGREIAGCVGEHRPDQKHPDRRCLLLFEHVEMAPRLGHVGRAGVECLERERIVSVEVIRIDVQDFLGPVIRRRGRRPRRMESIRSADSRSLDRLVELDRGAQMVDPFDAQCGRFSAGSVFRPVAIQAGEFLVNRRVLGARAGGLA